MPATQPPDADAPDHDGATPDDTFETLGLKPAVVAAVAALGFTAPTPIQSLAIPPLLAGRDVLGQAQTGTGKTAAFALPIVCRVDASRATPQALVLTPTRELALQVTEAVTSFAPKSTGVRALAVYGGASYGAQLSGLARGVHVVVGTPGRLMDLMERGALRLDDIALVVLDEADEMLRMGFIDDVAWILERVPATRQLALFSATMPGPVRTIARTHLRDPVEVRAASQQASAEGVRQRYLPVNGDEKVPALLLLLETEAVDGMLVFVRTKAATGEVADALLDAGVRASALSGDMSQAQRERTVEMLRRGQLDVVVATDVAARGLDVERISHVVNYDAPTDPETYVHRIGRTGRAGRAGDAVLFIEARQRRLVELIQRATRAPLDVMRPPSVDEINAARMRRFRERVLARVDEAAMSPFREVIGDLCKDQRLDPVVVAAALAQALHGPTPFLLDRAPIVDRSERVGPRARAAAPAPDARAEPAYRREPVSAPPPSRAEPPYRRDAAPPSAARGVAQRGPADEPVRARPGARAVARDGDAPRGRGSSNVPGGPPRAPRQGMAWYRIDVGRGHGAEPSKIVGAIANEAGIDGRLIGTIDLRDAYGFVELPESLPARVFRDLGRAWVCQRQLGLSRL